MLNIIKNKIVLIAVVIIVLLSFSNIAACKKHKNIYTLNYFESPIHRKYDDITVRLRKGNITFVNHDEDHSSVEITKYYELFVNDEEVELDNDQQELVKQFYLQTITIKKYAKKIGIEGAKIGLDGAMLGLKAIGCVFKLLSPDYDTDDLEDEIESAADDIEDKADRLERKAEKIEDLVYELEDYADEMAYNIPELDELGWF